MSQLKYLHEEVKHRKQEAYQILAQLYSDDQIKELCQHFASAQYSCIEDDQGRITFLATASRTICAALPTKSAFIPICQSAVWRNFMAK